jgi:hypothetical protein
MTVGTAVLPVDTAIVPVDTAVISIDTAIIPVVTAVIPVGRVIYFNRNNHNSNGKKPISRQKG